MNKILILLILILSKSVMANQLVIVQALSKTKRSFITRIGKKDGIQQGTKGTFTSKNFSLIAKATSVTREFAQWTLENPSASVPFDKGEIVTYNNSTENIWKLVSEDERKKMIKEKLFNPRSALLAKTALSRGLFESISGVSDQEFQRGGPIFEFYYDKEYTKNISAGIGFRFDSERSNSDSGGGSTNITRLVGMFMISYYLNKIESLFNGRPFASLGMGYGSTTHATESAGKYRVSGPTYILPSFALGLAMPIEENYDVVFDTAIESINSIVGSPTDDTQTYSDTNWRIGIGVKMYFK